MLKLRVDRFAHGAQSQVENMTDIERDVLARLAREEDDYQPATELVDAQLAFIGAGGQHSQHEEHIHSKDG